jgi:hypothetical protein
MSENNEALSVTANALAKKRADILFEIAEAEKRVERLRAELVQRICDALREHGGGCTSADVARKAMVDKGLDPVSDHTTRTNFVRRVTIAFRELVREGSLNSCRSRRLALSGGKRGEQNMNRAAE